MFLIVSSFIEILIVVGVYYHEHYDYYSFVEVEPKLEPIYKKKERYETLLRFAYKDGEISQDEPVISVNKMIQLAKSRSNVTFPSKLVKDFYAEMTHLGVFKTIGTRRYAMVRFDEALRLLETITG